MRTIAAKVLKSGFFMAVALLTLHAAPALAAESIGAGTYVGKVASTQASLTFRDVYAFRAVSSSGKPEVVLY